MGALATCTVVRLSSQNNDNAILKDGFTSNEEKSYEAHILFFENAKAYVVRDDSKRLFWVNIYQLTNIVPLT